MQPALRLWGFAFNLLKVKLVGDLSSKAALFGGVPG